MCCTGLQELAYPAYLSRFLVSGLQRVAPYCVRSGIGVVSIQPLHPRNTVRRSHEVRQVEPRDRRASTGLTKGPGLSDHLEARSPIQQVRHEAPVIDLMFDKDDTDPRREIFPSILFGLWYRNP